MVKIFLVIILCSQTLLATGLKQMYAISIENSPNGKILVLPTTGQSKQIGTVLRPATKVDKEGFTASKWTKNGTIAASAVNAIHFKVGHNREKNRGIIISLIPKNTKSDTSTIQTDFIAGTGIFGGEYPVLVGNPIYLVKENKETPLPPNYQPQIGDILLIKVLRPEPYPQEIVFENRFGGNIFVRYKNDFLPAGKVLKPVVGVGRFPGTKYTDIGRIRANHSGVIDISTSPLHQVGGFQIIPAEHAESPEMFKAKTNSQWMVVGPTNPENPEEEYFTLFCGNILPRYSINDLLEEDWLAKLNARTLVQVKYVNQDIWQPMPAIVVEENKPLPKTAETALKDIQAIRILFPVYNE